MKLVLEFVLFVGGLYATVYFIASRHEFDAGDNAFSIRVSIERPAAPIGLYMNLGIAAGTAVLAFAGALMIRANWRDRSSR